MSIKYKKYYFVPIEGFQIPINNYDNQENAIIENQLQQETEKKNQIEKSIEYY
jgi:hypothetical protein